MDAIPNNDMTHIENPSLYDLPPGLPSSDNKRQLYGLSWTHQIHCLVAIRDEYHSLSSNASNFVYGEDQLNAKDPTTSTIALAICVKLSNATLIWLTIEWFFSHISYS